MVITVFLSDDHTMFRQGLRLLLETQVDIKVVGEASNGLETARKVARIRPDIALVDIAMPELNGIEATRRISEICPSTKVIILSVYSTSEHIFQAFKAGALGYILKELAGDDVINAIRAVHAGKKYLCDKISEIMLDDYIRNREIKEAESPISRLSQREREILMLLAEGKSCAKIADILCLSPRTIETYRYRLEQKLGIGDLPNLVKFAIQHGLTSVE